MHKLGVLYATYFIVMFLPAKINFPEMYTDFIYTKIR